MAADGSIIIDTRINTKGFTKVPAKFEEVANRLKSKINDLSAKMESLGKTKIPTDEYKWLTNEIEKTNEELNKLYARQDRMEATGVDRTSQAWKNLRYDMQLANQKLSEYLAEKKRLEDSGGAFVSGDTTKEYTKMDSELAVLQKRYQEVYENIAEARKKLEMEAARSANRQAQEEAEAAQKTAAANQKSVAAMRRTVKPAARVAKSTEKASSSMGAFSGRLKSIVASAFIFNVLSAALRKLTDSIWGAISSTSEMQTALSNLKGAAFTAASPLINVLSKAFAYLANAAAKAFSYVSQLYSLLSGKSLSAISDTAEQMGNVADASGAAASNAEKAKRSLAGFDEITTLDDKKEPSGGGGGGASAPNYDFNLDSGIPKFVQDAADKIQELLEPLKSINFDSAESALERLGGSFANLGKSIGKSLEWAWKDILVPLSKWTIEKAAPKAVQLLASAFDLVSKSLDPVIDGLDDFMDDIDPIVDFIEDNVIIVLEDWEERFRFVAETMEENAPEITGIIRNLGEAFSKCWDIIGPVMTKLQETTKNTMTFMNREFSIGVGLIIDTLYGLSEFVLGALTGDWDRAWGGLSHIVASNKEAMGKSIKAFEEATGISFANIRDKAKTRFTEMKDAITGAWGKVVEYFAGHGIDLRVIGANITNSFKNALNRLIMELNAAIGTPLRNLNSGIVKLRSQRILGAYPFSGLPLIPVPKIPYLAQGAVIPPNAPFMAMLGDQRHGTNIEAPLSTIQEAVALVMEDFTGGMMAGFEATVAVLREILEAVYGIEIGDEVIAKAVQNYNRKMTVVNGG